MRFLFSILSLVSIYLLSCSGQLQKSPAEHLLLNPIQFKERLSKTQEPQLIDVRTAAEYEQGSISGAKNYNLLNGTFEKQLNSLDTNKTVFVFCAKGGRSSKAANLLEANGFNSIIDLKGGYTSWVNLKK